MIRCTLALLALATLTGCSRTSTTSACENRQLVSYDGNQVVDEPDKTPATTAKVECEPWP